MDTVFQRPRPAALFLLLLAFARCAAPRTATEALRLVPVPGVVYIADSLYMDEAEVANIHWLEYLYYLQKDSSRAAYEAALPDTTLWTAHRLRFCPDDTLNDPYLNYYLRFPGFRYFPVVGVSQAQAEAYCRWRSAKVTEVFRSSPDFRRARRRLRNYDVDIQYRLPTVAEWERAAAAGLDTARYPYGCPHPPQPTTRWQRRHTRSLQLPDSFRLRCPTTRDLPAGTKFYRADANLQNPVYYQLVPDQPPVYYRCLPCYYHSGIAGSLVDGEMVTEYIYAYPPNGYGLYNMLGNVAELTTTPGVAKGGSFVHPMAASRLRQSQVYTGPEPWLGFRSACTIRVRRKAP